MSTETVDILISGGGIAGLIATAAFAKSGHSVICVDPAPPVTQEGAAGSDLRSTAFLQPSVAILEHAGLWDRLAPFATPLQIMRIVDAGGRHALPRLVREFDAAEISDKPFGWNLQNWLLRRELAALLNQTANVSFRPGVGTAGVVAREDAALVALTNGQQIRARLVVAADGRSSPVREALGIGVKTLRYGQKALAFAVTHEAPHKNISTEVHRSGGPFTLVPLPDREGKPSSAVVWLDRGPEIERLASLSREDFAVEMNQRSAGVLGRLTQVTRLSIWPIISQIADAFAGPRTALIAEAAHVAPPIGAQGLNMSLADLTALVDLSQRDPGSPESLAAYARNRRPEACARLAGIDALNRASMARARPLRDLRAAVLGTLYASGPVRRMMMKAGMGLR